MNVNICRVCMCSLQDATQVVHIFDNLYRNNYNLVALISELFDVKIGINDVLSKVICKYCADQIVEFYKFHDMLLESDRKLRWNTIEEDVANVTDPVVPNILLTNYSVKEEICVEDESISVNTCDNKFESQALLDDHGCDDATDKLETIAQGHSTNCCTFKESSVAGTPIEIDRKSTKKCQKCKMKFASKYNLERHIKHKHELSSTVQCEQCEATFASKYNLKRHMIKHRRRDRHEKSSNHAYEDAKDKFETENSKKHINHKHKLSSIVQCEQCEATFASKFNLKRHMIKHGRRDRHEKSSNHTYEDGKDKFKNKAERHSTNSCTSEQSSVTGTPTKMYKKSTKKCKICKTTFVTNYNLKRHIKTKHELFILQCEQCEATFATKFDLNRHIKYRHEKSSPHKCHICHRQFSNSYGLKRHVKHFHS